MRFSKKTNPQLLEEHNQNQILIGETTTGLRSSLSSYNVKHNESMFQGSTLLDDANGKINTLNIVNVTVHTEAREQRRT